MLRKGRSGGSRFEASTDKNKILSKKNFTKKKKKTKLFQSFYQSVLQNKPPPENKTGTFGLYQINKRR
jgi:hypothetical protein